MHPRRKGIVVTELPYLVGPERVIEQIKTLVKARKLQGIADVKDLSDLTNGTRLVIEVKNGFNPDALLEQLYKLTKMEDSFAINAVALVEGQPRTLTPPRPAHGLPRAPLRGHPPAHRVRPQPRRRAAAPGRGAADRHARHRRRDRDHPHQRRRRRRRGHRLIAAFELTEIQANYILDMPLRRLTRFSRLELEAERDQLTRRIAELTADPGQPGAAAALVGNELAEIAQQHGTPRRTILLAASGVAATAATATPLEVADDPCWVLLSSAGLLARTDHADPLPAGGTRANHDVIVSADHLTTARADCGLVTSAGRLIKINALDLPDRAGHGQRAQPAGRHPRQRADHPGADERVLCLTTLAADSLGLALGTAHGCRQAGQPRGAGQGTPGRSSGWSRATGSSAPSS